MEATKRRTPPVNADLTALAHIEVENVGGELIETIVTDWTGTAPAFVKEETKFSDTIEGGAIGTDDVTTIVIPSDLVAVESPDFGLGSRLRYSQRGECHTVRVTGIEAKPDLGFIRCVTDPEDDPDFDLCS
jgi:hypothetical protein